MKGFLYLRHVGISLQTRASLLRSSGGSLRFEKVSELLRKTELDALIASRGGKTAGHGYFVEPEDDYYEDNLDDEHAEDSTSTRTLAGTLKTKRRSTPRMTRTRRTNPWMRSTTRQWSAT